MIVDNPELRASYRGIRCENCKERTATDCAHILARGIGNGKRVDIRLNLVGLCRICHNENENGREPCEWDLLALVSLKYGYLQPEVRERIFLVMRTPKEKARLCPYCKGTGRNPNIVAPMIPCEPCDGVGLIDLATNEPYRELRREFH